VEKFIPGGARSVEWCHRWASGPLSNHCSRPVRTSRFEWMYIPQTPLIIPLMSGTSGAAPRRSMGANSIVWLIRISKACERAPASQSMLRAEWCASCSRHSRGELCCQRWNQ